MRSPNPGEVTLANNFNLKGKRTLVKIMIVEIAKVKHNPDPTACGDCKCGLGICRFCFFCTKDNRNANEQEIVLYEENGEYFFEIVLTSPTITGVDYDFYIDNDVKADDVGFVIPKASYRLDTSMGSYGGYKIKVEKN